MFKCWGVGQMIARTYGRRSGGSMRKTFDGAVSEPFSQESPQDVYDFTLSSSQESTRWSFDPYAFHDSSDPYGFNNLSSQESDELTILPSRGLRGNGDFGGFDGVLRKSSKKAKIGDSELPCTVNSSPDSDELTILSSKNGLENGDFGCPDGVLGRVRDLEVLCLNSSQESDELTSLKVKKSKENGKIDGVCRKPKKVKENAVLQKKNKKVKSKVVVVSSPVAIGPTATLMETQEFGEMMEHVDEVNFAMDGLKKGQPVRVQRGSLLSLLSICGTASQRRMLRAHGMDKTIIDAIMGLSFDDSPSNLAAAALFYVLTSDGNEDGLLDSPSCIRFLMKLLRPLSSDAAMLKEPTFGSKLLAIRKKRDSLQNAVKGSESCAAIMLKVHEVLVSCKDLKPRDGFDGCTELPELNPKWISLLTMEKASFSTVSIEDTSGRVRRNGVKFKEKLRELGGLNAVVEVARSCLSVMEGWLEHNPSSVLGSKDKAGLESMVLLLKSLKIMENATFLSNDNQSHLLGMKGNFDCQIAPRSFTKLILSVIKILSAISSAQNSLAGSEDGKTHINSNESTLVGTSSLEGLSTSQNGRWLTSSSHTSSSKSNSVTPSTSLVDPWLKVRIDSSLSGSSGGKSGDFTCGTATSNGFKENCSRVNNHNVLSSTKSEPMDDSQDPFAFDEDDFEPSKWDLLSGREVSSRTHNSIAKFGGTENDSQSLLLLDQEESQMENVHSSKESCSSTFVDEKSNLLADCLLSAVKVLMNLTNDNPMGCQQIAACGGLEALSSLIASHFPNFSSYLPPFHRQENKCVSPRSSMEVERLKDGHLTDQELDLLVAILGLLVNLVEKDGLNRKRLAAVRVSLRNLDGLEKENSTDLLPLLCSIFLANQGAGEAAGEGNCLSWDDKDALLQGEKEAEKMILEAYSALLLAFLSTESRSIRKAIAECLPDHNIAILVPVLERFVEFHFSLEMITPETHSAVLEVIESCRIP